MIQAIKDGFGDSDVRLDGRTFVKFHVDLGVGDEVRP
jgi:hypothetical protein